MSSSNTIGEVFLARALREQRRQNRLGPDAQCEACGNTTLVHLNRARGLMVCGCCLALLRGREVFEDHHVAGRGEGRTIRVCANCHADLSELQRDWAPSLGFDERFQRGLADIAALRRGEQHA